LAGAALAQLPDVSVYADLRATVRQQDDGRLNLRWVDPEGRVSVVGLRFVLENGSRIKVSQRFQKVPGDPDALDEAWISLNDEWVFGKLYLPFGRQFLVRESVPAVQFTTQLALDAIPVTVAVFDGGDGRPRGVAFRLGREEYGFSAAFGDHLGVQGTTLSPFRNPGQAPGKGRGWKTLYGADGRLTIGSVRLEGELLLIRNGHTSGDVNLGCTDIRAFWKPIGSPFSFEAAWSRSWSDSDDVLRFGLTAPLSEKVSLRPPVRIDKDGLREASVTCWLRL
jgi:hypothetical protein